MDCVSYEGMLSSSCIKLFCVTGHVVVNRGRTLFSLVERVRGEDGVCF